MAARVVSVRLPRLVLPKPPGAAAQPSPRLTERSGAPTSSTPRGAGFDKGLAEGLRFWPVAGCVQLRSESCVRPRRAGGRQPGHGRYGLLGIEEARPSHLGSDHLASRGRTRMQRGPTAVLCAQTEGAGRGHHWWRQECWPPAMVSSGSMALRPSTARCRYRASADAESTAPDDSRYRLTTILMTAGASKLNSVAVWADLLTLSSQRQ